MSEAGTTIEVLADQGPIAMQTPANPGSRSSARRFWHSWRHFPTMRARASARKHGAFLRAHPILVVRHPNALGLVVGYVQSGKTTSMIAAAAMGRDNGFGLVIFIAGTSDILLEQSRNRLESSLRLGDPSAYRRWVHLPSPKPAAGATRLTAELEDWLDGHTDRSTVLVTVMKQHKHLKDLADVLKEAAERVNLVQIPALVFDDEADQASLNLKSQPGRESATYRDLRLVRSQANGTHCCSTRPRLRPFS